MSKNNKTSIDICVSDNNLFTVKSLGTLHQNISQKKKKTNKQNITGKRAYNVIYRSFIHYRNRVHIHLNK